MRKAVCRPAPWAVLCLIGVLLGATTGCQRPTQVGAPAEQQKEKGAPAYNIVKPERKTVSRRIEQPGFNIEAFQETAIYPRISGYILKWKADMGDRVKKNDPLAEMYVPEMVVAVKQKEAAVRQTESQVKQAQAAVLIARARRRGRKASTSASPGPARAACWTGTAWRRRAWARRRRRPAW